MNWNPVAPDAVAQRLTWLVPVSQLLMLLLRLAGQSCVTPASDVSARRHSLSKTSSSVTTNFINLQCQ